VVGLVCKGNLPDDTRPPARQLSYISVSRLGRRFAELRYGCAVVRNLRLARLQNSCKRVKPLVPVEKVRALFIVYLLRACTQGLSARSIRPSRPTPIGPFAFYFKSY
jgi:hypothetical protein